MFLMDAYMLPLLKYTSFCSFFEKTSTLFRTISRSPVAPSAGHPDT